MNYLKKRKELIPFILIIAVFIYAGFNLFSNQVEASKFTKAGANVLPSYTPGGAGRCNIPTYEDYYNESMTSGNTGLQSEDSPGTKNTVPAKHTK